MTTRPALLRRAASGAVAFAAGCIAALTMSTAPVAGAAQEAVPWRWWDGALHQITHGGQSIPGLGDDSCRPSPRHPNPVILAHGTGLNGGNNWATLARSLMNEGYCVWAPTYGAPPGLPFVGGLDALDTVSAVQIAREIDRVRALTGAAKVDLVGHSQGTGVAGYATKVLRPDAVDRFVDLAGFWASPRLLEEPFLPGSMGDLVPDPRRDTTLRWLGDDGTPFVPTVQYTLVTTPFDGLSTFDATLLEAPLLGPNVRHVAIPDGCPADRSNHLTLTTSPRVVDIVLNAFDPANAVTPRCVSADGLIGPTAPIPPRNAP